MEDSLERIERDARLDDARHYWNCRGFHCYHECPAVKDGKDPAERYGVGDDCEAAWRLDLLRRQREVLTKEGAVLAGGFCPKCGRHSKEGANFCQNCGLRLVW